MFSLSVALQDNPVVWTLMFKEKQTAETAFEKLVPNPGNIFPNTIEDDFGQKIINNGLFAGAILEDLDLSKLAHIERALHVARTNAKAQSMASADPTIKAAMLAHGPAVLSSMNGNMRS